MKAALYQGIKQVEIATLPDYQCADDAIILKNVYASICGTDVAVYHHGLSQGHRITVGREFGHEAVCIVSAVGKNVKDIQVGDRVYPYPLLVTGDRSRAGTIGAFSEYIYCPKPKWGESIYHIDPRISDQTAALIEPFTVGCRAARRALPQKGETAVIFGAGTIGIAVAIALQYFGCRQVVLCDHSDFRLKLCKQLGFQTCNTRGDLNLEQLSALLGTTSGVHGNAIDCDIWIDAAGADSIFSAFETQGKYHSRMVLVAVGTSRRETDILGLTFGQKSLIGSGGYTPQDVVDVMEIMRSGRWEIARLITDIFPLELLPQAIERAADVEHALNVLIQFDP